MFCEASFAYAKIGLPKTGSPKVQNQKAQQPKMVVANVHKIYDHSRVINFISQVQVQNQIQNQIQNQSSISPVSESI